ncbi:MAG: zinc/iron-chelating domain-containing protein [Desulfovibrio sp.]|nr:zinc/iron-chelating domain-containing protein [Desulfovibrio sp.]
MIQEPGTQGSDPAPCALCAAAGNSCCRTEPDLAQLIFPLSPAERQRLDAARDRTDDEAPPWAARPNTKDFIHAAHALFPRDKKRIDELFPPGGEHWSLRLHPDGTCVFLGEEGCRLPRAFRPGYCLLFPAWVVGGMLTLFFPQNCLMAREGPARCAGLMGTDKAGLCLIYARLRREWGLAQMPQCG